MKIKTTKTNSLPCFHSLLITGRWPTFKCFPMSLLVRNVDVNILPIVQIGYKYNFCTFSDIV